MNTPGHRRRRATAARSRCCWSTSTRAEPVDLRRGDRIAQLVVQRVEQARVRRGGATPRFGARRRRATVLPAVSRTLHAAARSRRSAREVPPQEVRRARRRRAPDDGSSAEAGPPGPPGADGPFDASEVRSRATTSSASTSARLLLTPARGPRAAAPGRRGHRPGAVAVILAGDDGAVELRAFAAPRNGDLWSEVRPPDRRPRSPGCGGTATEREGRWGTELVSLTVEPRDGQRPAGLPGHRHQRPALDAARHAVRPPGRGAPTRPATGRTRSARSSCVRGDARRSRSATPLPLTMPPNAQRDGRPGMTGTRTYAG